MTITIIAAVLAVICAAAALVYGAIKSGSEEQDSEYGAFFGGMDE